MLGIIIGVASVITMLAIGQGSKRSIQAQISEMGSNMIMIQPGADMRGGVRQDASAMETLKLQDYEDIVNETRYVSATSPSVNSSGQVIYGANNAPTTVYGISPDYMEIRRYEVEDGDMFSDQDVQTAAKVCVIGKTVVDNLFPGGENPVGRVIRFQKLPFRVVGVLKSKGYNSMGMDQDDLILAPYTTIQKKILAITHLQGITCSALKEEYTDPEYAGVEYDVDKYDGYNDDVAGRGGWYLSSRWWYRYHEYHVRERDGAYAGDRPPYEYRCERHGYLGSVLDRVYPYQRDRGIDRRAFRRGSRLDRECRGAFPDLYPAMERTALFRGMYRHRGVLRMVSR